jgi:hypothetical protein
MNIQRIVIKGFSVYISEKPIGEENRVLVSRASVIDNKIGAKVIKVRFDKLLAYHHLQGEVLVQDYFSELSPEDRDFILLGITTGDDS